VLRKRLNPGTEPISNRRELSKCSAGSVRIRMTLSLAAFLRPPTIRYSARPTIGVLHIFGALLMRRPSRAGKARCQGSKGITRR
jgi:hypothetical protein